MISVKLKKYRYQLLLILIVTVLFLVNYHPKSYLSGWDNLQTELYPWLAVKRAFFSVWQEYQSFGLLAGMAHGADLVRALFLWIVSFVLPQNMIRYFYHFLMLLIGGLGAFEMLKRVQYDKQKNGVINNEIMKQSNNEEIAFLAALFYLLNLGTIQIFYLPFEPFSTFFAFLPWGIWIFIKLTTNNQYPITKKNLLIFFLINLLGTASFYVQQLFLVYLLILALVFFGKFVNSIFYATAVKMELIKRTVIAVFLILLINSFWILPQLYFMKTSSYIVYEAKANQLATEDVYFQNREKGIVSYFLKLEGFYFDLFDKNKQPLFSPWKNYFKIFWPLQYFFALLMVVGLIYSLRKKDFTFIFVFLLIVIVFLNATWPVSLLDEIIRSNKFLNQIFRSPFTKFIIPYSLLYGYFFTVGLGVILNLFKNLILRIRAQNVIIAFLIFLYSLPAFAGNFFSNEMKIKIPQDYFELISYFKTVDKNERIALLPDYTFWGWFFHRWGYNGSGFLWYGIEQPIVSRTFDVWSDKSESYFWEIKSATEAEDINRFEKILEKYDISYLLVDYSLLPVVGTMRGLQYDRINHLLTASTKIFLVKKWKNIALYQVKNKNFRKGFISLKTNLTNIGPKIKLTDNDRAFFDFGDYYTDKNYPNVYYPFLDLNTQTRLKDKNWQIKETEDNFLIEIKDNVDLSGYRLNQTKDNFQAILYQNEKLATYSGKINIQLVNNNHLQITIDKLLIEKVNISNPYQEKCFKNTLCFSFTLPYLSQKYGYLLKIKNKNLTGQRLYFYVLDETKKQSFLEDRLQNDEEFFILPPKYQYGLGYNITFHNTSYQNLKSANKLTDLEVYLFPYENLKSLCLVSPIFYLSLNRVQDKNINLDNIQAKKLNYFTYQISNLQITNNQYPITIVLSQSYHPGWKAYQIQCQNSKLKCQIQRYLPFLFSTEIKDHVLVNNWANGWKIETQNSNLKSQNEIVIVFLPQYLQFLGFGILVLCLLLFFLIVF